MGNDADAHVMSTAPVVLFIGCMVRRIARRLVLPLVAREDKNQCLRVDLQQRVIIGSALVDADSAVDENVALATLLKGRTGCALGVSSNVGSYEYSRVSLPDSVEDAPPLIGMLPAEAKFSRGVSETDAVATGGSR